MFNVTVYQFTYTVFPFCQQNLARLKDDSTRLITFFFFDTSCTLCYFCAEVYFTYVELGSMWVVVDLCCCWQPNRQVSFIKEVVVRVNDLVFWLTVWLNFENVLLTFEWYVFVWQKCSMLTTYANGHFFNKWNCVSMPEKCVPSHTHSYTPPPPFFLNKKCLFW